MVNECAVVIHNNGLLVNYIWKYCFLKCWWLPPSHLPLLLWVHQEQVSWTILGSTEHVLDDWPDSLWGIGLGNHSHWAVLFGWLWAKQLEGIYRSFCSTITHWCGYVFLPSRKPTISSAGIMLSCFVVSLSSMLFHDVRSVNSRKHWKY